MSLSKTYYIVGGALVFGSLSSAVLLWPDLSDSSNTVSLILLFAFTLLGSIYLVVKLRNQQNLITDLSLYTLLGFLPLGIAFVALFGSDGVGRAYPWFLYLTMIIALGSLLLAIVGAITGNSRLSSR